MFSFCLCSGVVVNVSSKSNSAALNREQCCQPMPACAGPRELGGICSHPLSRPTLALSKVVQLVVTAAQGLHRAISDTIPRFSR